MVSNFSSFETVLLLFNPKLIFFEETNIQRQLNRVSFTRFSHQTTVGLEQHLQLISRTNRLQVFFLNSGTYLIVVLCQSTMLQRRNQTKPVLQRVPKQSPRTKFICKALTDTRWLQLVDDTQLRFSQNLKLLTCIMRFFTTQSFNLHSKK